MLVLTFEQAQRVFGESANSGGKYAITGNYYLRFDEVWEVKGNTELTGNQLDELHALHRRVEEAQNALNVALVKGRDAQRLQNFMVDQELSSLKSKFMSWKSRKIDGNMPMKYEQDKAREIREQYPLVSTGEEQNKLMEAKSALLTRYRELQQAEPVSHLVCTYAMDIRSGNVIKTPTVELVGRLANESEIRRLLMLMDPESDVDIINKTAQHNTQLGKDPKYFHTSFGFRMDGVTVEGYH